MREELFVNAQEKLFINDVLKACRDPRTFMFIVHVYSWIMSPLEHIRRWGLCCPHTECNNRRRAGEHHVKCWMNGRRLREAWTWLQLRIQEFRLWSTTVTPADIGGSEEWCDIIRGLCAKAASEIMS